MIIVTDHGFEPNKRIESAQLRLAQAVGRLEGALDRQSRSNAAPDLELAADMNRLKDENNALKELVGQTSSRIDITLINLKKQMAMQTKGQA